MIILEQLCILNKNDKSLKMAVKVEQLQLTNKFNNKNFSV